MLPVAAVTSISNALAFNIIGFVTVLLTTGEILRRVIIEAGVTTSVPAPAAASLLNRTPPPVIVKGSKTVLIHGMPAARWTTSGDLSACTAQLGDRCFGLLG